MPSAFRLPLLALSCVLAFTACEKEEAQPELSPIIPSETAALTSRSGDGPRISESLDTEFIELGAQRANPYELLLVNEVIADLYGGDLPPVTRTHRYIRTGVLDQADLASLIDWSDTYDLELWDHPLDYDIAVEGQRYEQPGLADGEITPQYIVLPEGTPLPDAPATEILADLYLTDGNPFIFIESYTRTGNEDLIEADVTGEGGIPLPEIDGPVPPSMSPPIDCPPGCVPVLVYDGPSPEPHGGNTRWICDCEGGGSGGGGEPELNACGCPMPVSSSIPAGCVRVDDDNGRRKGVWNAKVITRNGLFSINSVFTDRAGCWSLDDPIQGRLRIKVKFRNDNVSVKNMAYAGGIRPLINFRRTLRRLPYNNVSVFYPSFVDANTSLGRRYWAAAHVVTSVEEYRLNAGGDGVPLFNSRLTYINYPDDGNASAPMLKGVAYSSYPDWVIAAVGGLFLQSVQALSVPFRPHVTHPYDGGETAETFNGTLAHEMGHTSHYALVGETLWPDLRNHVIFNLGWGAPPFTPIGSAGPAMALSEGLGSYAGARYGGDGLGDENSVMANGYIPTGLYWDIEDAAVDNVTFGGAMVTDMVRGLTPGQIFSAAQVGVESVADHTTALGPLVATTPTPAGNYAALVGLYDVF